MTEQTDQRNRLGFCATVVLFDFDNVNIIIITAEDHIDVVVVFQGSSICIALRRTYAKGNATFNDITDHQLICIHLRK